ncbi:lytic regulatory protein [Staphylococcus piscifermentans]|uniref:Lytic regulatory protein n=1 Tax=Staphylococcus piscifermentans TaxID=70258 RepID=A0A239TT03_9STAP|nr:hypothetical protein [Staphylococcus piscifermentans]RTX82998.1 hypothetical protein CD139_10300 [Staphylococcus piscifermentans]GEP84910.1 lytic regulatory protein [Staphylococcus piscifermentans]SNV00645.1 lytic regulatory protein [Staphylococcus piscifermentans]
MFTFYKQAFKNAKPQNAKTALFSILTFFVFILIVAFTFMPVQQALQMFMMSMMYQGPMFQAALPLIIALIIPLLIFLFVGFQLVVGTINVVYKAIHKEDVHLTDVFTAFKKGSYLKSVKLALFTLLVMLITIIVVTVVNQLFSALMHTILSRMQSGTGGNMGALITVQLIGLTISKLIASLFIWFFTYIVIAYVVAYLRDRQAGAFKDVKQSFKSLKNGRHSWFKLFLGLILLNLIVIIFSEPIPQLVVLATQHMSQNLAKILVYVVIVIMYVIRIVVYYLNLMAIVQFFSKATEHFHPESKQKSTTIGDKVVESSATVKGSKKAKEKDSNKDNKTNHVTNKASETKDKAEEKFNTDGKQEDLKETKEEYSDSTFDHLKNKKKDVDERSDDFKK